MYKKFQLKTTEISEVLKLFIEWHWNCTECYCSLQFIIESVNNTIGIVKNIILNIKNITGTV